MWSISRMITLPGNVKAIPPLQYKDRFVSSRYLQFFAKSRNDQTLLPQSDELPDLQSRPQAAACFAPKSFPGDVRSLLNKPHAPGFLPAMHRFPDCWKPAS